MFAPVARAHVSRFLREPRTIPRLAENTRDRELAARLVAGDEAALREAYREHVAAVNGLAMRVLSNEALA